MSDDHRPRRPAMMSPAAMEAFGGTVDPMQEIEAAHQTAAVLVHAGRSATTRLFAAAGLALLTLGFVWSGSRGGFIALFAVVGFVVLRFSAIPLRWRLSATAVVAVIVLATASGQFWEQMGTITSETDYNHTSETGRLQIWSRGITPPA